jgi:hypothetical protein
MIISLHLPKTAGISFSAALEEHFGSGFLRDYYDYPINTPAPERNQSALQSGLAHAEKDFAGITCIHGHFLPVKYLLAAGRHEGFKFVTWMRHPVERVLSHYFFWRKHYDPKIARSLHRRVVEEDWSVERFCLGPELKNLYGQFLWAFPIDYFDFIGVTEFFQQDLEFFARHYLGISPEAKKYNVGDKGEGGYPIDASLRKQIEAFHAGDMELYQRALEKRSRREASAQI